MCCPLHPHSYLPTLIKPPPTNNIFVNAQALGLCLEAVTNSLYSNLATLWQNSLTASPTTDRVLCKYLYKSFVFIHLDLFKTLLANSV